MEKTIYLDGNSLTLDDIVEICRHGAKVALTDEAKKAIQISRDIVEKILPRARLFMALTQASANLSMLPFRKMTWISFSTI